MIIKSSLEERGVSRCWSVLPRFQVHSLPLGLFLFLGAPVDHPREGLLIFLGGGVHAWILQIRAHGYGFGRGRAPWLVVGRFKSKNGCRRRC